MACNTALSIYILLGILFAKYTIIAEGQESYCNILFLLLHAPLGETQAANDWAEFSTAGEFGRIQS